MKKLLIFLMCFITQVAMSQEFWGVTSEGGIHSGGVIFKLDSNGNNFRKIHDFYKYPDGYPSVPPVKGSDGLFYGTIQYGGNNNAGALYSYDIDEDSIKISKCERGVKISGSRS